MRTPDRDESNNSELVCIYIKIMKGGGLLFTTKPHYASLQAWDSAVWALYKPTSLLASCPYGANVSRSAR
jgi:hypothetical protein